MGTKKRRTGRLADLILIICILVFCFSAWKLAGYLIEYKEGESEYDSIVSEYVQPDTKGQKTNEKDQETPPVVDFKKLKKINPDIVGWISIRHTDIQYPLVQGEDNQYYLDKTFKKNLNHAGSIFLDSENESDFTSDNTIIYGHNLKTGKMFGSLRKYEEKDYWKKHRYIFIVTEEKSMKYEIFSSYRTVAGSDTYRIGFASDEEYEEYLDQCTKSGYYETGVETGPEDHIITLSTCTSDTEDGRRVVQAKKIYEEENDNVQ